MPNLDNYKNLTMEALGGSLLSQKAASDKRRRRSGKRDEKINKIIAVLLGTQAIFKTALKDRILEGDELELVQKMSDSSAATEMMALSQVYGGLKEEFLMSPNALELYKDYDKNSEQVNIFREGAANALTALIEKQNPELIKELRAMKQLNIKMYGLVDQYMAPYFFGKLSKADAEGLGNKEWAGKTRAQIITTGAKDYFGVDAETAISQMFGIDINKLQGTRLQNKLLKERQLKGQAGIIDFAKSIFNREPAIFSKRDPLEQEGIKKVLEATDMDKFINSQMKEIMVNLRKNINTRDQASVDSFAMGRDDTGKYKEVSKRVIQKQIERLRSGDAEYIRRLNTPIKLQNGQEVTLGEAKEAQIRLLQMMHQITFEGASTSDIDNRYAFKNLQNVEGMLIAYQGRDAGVTNKINELIKVADPTFNPDDYTEMELREAIWLVNADLGFATKTPEDYRGWGWTKGRGGTKKILPGEIGFKAGELAIDRPRPAALRASIREERSSNLIPKNIDTSSFYLSSPIKNINTDGKPVYSEELIRLLEYADKESIDDIKIVFSNYLNDIQDRGYGEEGEQILATLLDDKKLSAVFAGQNTDEMLNSYREGSLSLYNPKINLFHATDTSAYTDFLEESSKDEIFPEKIQPQYDIPTITSLLDRE